MTQNMKAQTCDKSTNLKNKFSPVIISLFIDIQLLRDALVSFTSLGFLNLSAIS
jgi:hypothetical protein